MAVEAFLCSQTCLKEEMQTESLIIRIIEMSVDTLQWVMIFSSSFLTGLEARPSLTRRLALLRSEGIAYDGKAEAQWWIQGPAYEASSANTISQVGSQSGKDGVRSTSTIDLPSDV